MSWHNDCSTIDGILIAPYEGNYDILSDGESIYSNTSEISLQYPDCGIEIETGIQIDGDFECALDLTLPAMIDTSENIDYYFDFYLYTNKGYPNAMDFYFYKDENTLSNQFLLDVSLFSESTEVPIPIVLPFNGVLKFTRVGNLWTAYVNEQQIIQTLEENNSEAYSVNKLYFDWWIDTNVEQYPIEGPIFKINDINIIGNVTFPQNNPNITSLSLVVPEGKKSSGLSPNYNTYTSTYTETVAQNVDTANILIQTIQDTAIVSINNNVVDQSLPIPINLNIGENILNIHVISGDETETLDITYTITRRDFVSDLYIPNEIVSYGNIITPAVDLLNINKYVMTPYSVVITSHEIVITLSDALTLCTINGEIIKRNYLNGNLIKYDINKNIGAIIELESEDGLNSISYEFKIGELNNGLGTLESPYEIRTPEELVAMGQMNFTENWGDCYNILPPEGNANVLFVYGENNTSDNIFIAYEETIDEITTYKIEKFNLPTKTLTPFADFDEAPAEMIYTYISGTGNGGMYFVKTISNKLYKLNRITGEKTTLISTPTTVFRNMLYAASFQTFAIASISGNDRIVQWNHTNFTWDIIATIPAMTGINSLICQSYDLYIILNEGSIYLYNKTGGYKGIKVTQYGYDFSKIYPYMNGFCAIMKDGSLKKYVKDDSVWTNLISSTTSNTNFLIKANNFTPLFVYQIDKGAQYGYSSNSLLIADLKNNKWFQIAEDKDNRMINPIIFIATINPKTFYVISNKGEMFTFESSVHYFKQMNDIDLSDYPSWYPISKDSINNRSFIHSFDGNGYKITGLNIDVCDEYGQYEYGLFNAIDTDGNIRNIKIEDGVVNILDENISSYVSEIGLLTGLIYNGNFSNIEVNGNININSNISNKYASLIGGLAGEIVPMFLKKITLNMCKANISVNNLGGQVYNDDTGGLIGYARGLEGNLVDITNCQISANISGIEYLGLLFGKGAYLNLENCMMNGVIVTEDGYASTFGGFFTDSFIKNCFSILDLTVNIDPYGLAGFGYQVDDTTLLNCYSIATITNNTGEPLLIDNDVAGFLAWSSPTSVTGCYFNSETLPSEVIDQSVAIPKTTTEMKQLATYIDWNFESVWILDEALNDGYPTLRVFLESSPQEVVYQLIKILDINNFIIEGGKIIGDNTNNEAINIKGSNKIVLLNTEIKDFNQDAIIIEGSELQDFSDDLKLIGIVCDNNNNAINIKSAKNLLGKNLVLKNHHENGVVFNADNPSEFAQNIIFENLQTEDNNGYGVNFNFSDEYLADDTHPGIDITIDGITDVNSVLGGVSNYTHIIDSENNILIDTGTEPIPVENFENIPYDAEFTNPEVWVNNAGIKVLQDNVLSLEGDGSTSVYTVKQELPVNAQVGDKFYLRVFIKGNSEDIKKISGSIKHKQVIP